MGTITFGYDNHVDDSDVTITHSTEVTGFEAENVAAPQASQVFRTTVLDPGSVGFSWPSSIRYQLVAAIGCKVSAWANRCIQSNSFNTTWTKTNMGTFTPATDILIDDARWTLNEGADAGVQHRTQLALTDLLDAVNGEVEHHGTILTVVAKWVSGEVGKFRLAHVGDVSGTKYEGFDIENGALLGSSGLTTSAITLVDTDTYRCSILMAPALDTTRTVRIQCLDAAGATSYNGTSRLLTVSAVQVAPSVSATSIVVPEYYETGTVTGAAWRAYTAPAGPANIFDFLPVSMGGNDSALGAVGTYHLFDSVGDTDDLVIEVHDESNALSQIDIGRVFIGPVWQPSSHTFVGLRTAWSDSGKFRKWTIDLGQQITEAETFGELHDLARIVKVTSSSRLTETPSGQLIGPDGAVPIVVILDADETDNPQTQLLYGFVVGLTADHTRRSATDFSVQIEVWESIA